jgi:hypothetical protein
MFIVEAFSNQIKKQTANEPHARFRIPKKFKDKILFGIT